MFALSFVTSLLIATATPEIVTHTIESPYQAGPVEIEVLAPDAMAPDMRYRVVYILPVAPGTTSRWGSGIREAARADIANRFSVICVAPSFSEMPWFADHPNDPTRCQESHFIEVVLPWVEKHLPVEASRRGRLLLGFSKSGYGAIMLLLRHPDLFERAIAWDAPLGKTAPDQFNMMDVFGSGEHFAPYSIPRLLGERAEELKGGPPRILLMPDVEGDHAMDDVVERLRALGIPHGLEYTSGLRHHWDSGWLSRAAEWLLTEGAPNAGVRPGESPAPR